MGKRIAVVGAGAVGGYVGAHLAHLGQDVTLIDPWPEHVQAIRERGFEVTGLTPEESIRVSPPSLHLTDVQGLSKQRPIDIAFVSVKSYDTEWATALIAPYLSERGYVVSLQNCINEPRIAGIVGWDRTVGCIAALLAAELTGPGRVCRTVPLGTGGIHSTFRVGEVHGRMTARLEELAALIGGIDSVTATSNLWGERWSKLCLNGMRNGVSAATGLGGNARDRHDVIRRFVIQLGGEAVRIGQALGYELEHIANLPPDRLAQASEGDAAALEEIEALMLQVSNVSGRSDLQRPSMAQDMAKGRRTEIDFINGVIVARGEEIGRAAPANARLTRLVKRVERGELPARPENLIGPET